MKMEEGLDTGAMISAEAVAITPTTTAEELHDALAAMGVKMIMTALDDLDTGKVSPQSQPDEGVTYAKKLERGGPRSERKKADTHRRQDNAQIDTRTRPPLFRKHSTSDRYGARPPDWASRGH